MKTILSLPGKLFEFIKSVFQEFRLVEKITLKETVRLTLGVILFSGTLGIFLALLDKGLITLVTKILELN